jgi:CheY-like chemotaxis protein
MMSVRVLWLDNDLAYLEPYVEALTDEGYAVTVVASVGEAEYRLKREQFDLVILDVMIPTKDDKEEVDYTPDDTEQGQKTGLVFYRRVRDLLARLKTRVLVMTVRLDEDVLNEFRNYDLPRDRFATKFALREVDVFLDKVNSVLNDDQTSAVSA